MRNSIFEIPIILQTLNIITRETQSAKSINLVIIRKFIKYSLKNVLVKTMFILTFFEILMFEGRSVLAPAQQGTGSERVKEHVHLINGNGKDVVIRGILIF